MNKQYIIIGLFSLLSAVLIVKWVVPKYVAQHEQEQLVEQAKIRLAKKREARQQAEQQLALLRKKATVKSNEQLTRGNAQQRLRVAAANFIGFYLTNTRTRVAYCEQLGVDVKAFAKQFHAAHEDIYQRATNILAQENVTPNTVYQSIQAQTLKVIEKDMQSVAGNLGINQTQACQGLVRNAVPLVKRMHIKLAQPQIYSILSSGG